MTQQQIDDWNSNYPPGSRCEVTLDSGEDVHAKTTSPALWLGDGTAVVCLEGRGGSYDICQLRMVRRKKRRAHRKVRIHDGSPEVVGAWVLTMRADGDLFVRRRHARRGVTIRAQELILRAHQLSEGLLGL